MTKRATWRSASIHTPRELARKGDRLDRVIAALRRGLRRYGERLLRELKEDSHV
jgi:hypothetical protein